MAKTAEIAKVPAPSAIAMEIVRRFVGVDDGIADRGEFTRHVAACLPAEVRAGKREPTPGEEFVAYGAATRRRAALEYLGQPLDANTDSSVGRAELSRDLRQLSQSLTELRNQVQILKDMAEIIDG